MYLGDITEQHDGKSLGHRASKDCLETLSCLVYLIFGYQMLGIISKTMHISEIIILLCGACNPSKPPAIS